jgi:hypothetical protein
MLSVVIIVASLIADLAIGMAAYKMAKSSMTTNATLLSLLSKHAEKIEDHEFRIVVLEKAS